MPEACPLNRKTAPGPARFFVIKERSLILEQPCRQFAGNARFRPEGDDAWSAANRTGGAAAFALLAAVLRAQKHGIAFRRRCSGYPLPQVTWAFPAASLSGPRSFMGKRGSRHGSHRAYAPRFPLAEDVLHALGVGDQPCIMLQIGQRLFPDLLLQLLFDKDIGRRFPVACAPCIPENFSLMCLEISPTPDHNAFPQQISGNLLLAQPCSTIFSRIVHFPRSESSNRSGHSSCTNSS